MTLNNPRAMLERLAFAGYLALLVAACGAIGLGLIFALLLGEPRVICLGLAGAALTAILRELGYRRWHFRVWEDSLEPAERGWTLLDAAHHEPARELAAVFERLAAADQAGHPDVWEVQELRRRANALLARDPALREVFAEEIQRRPELR